MGKKSRFGSGSGMNAPDHISESLETFFGLKVLKFFYADPDLGPRIQNLLDPEPGIRDGKNSDPVSGGDGGGREGAYRHSGGAEIEHSFSLVTPT